MEKEQNIFLFVKAAVTGVAAAFTAAFGWLGWLVVAWLCAMSLDWMTGSASGLVRHEWSSAVARNGIWHKAGMVAVVLVAGSADLVLGTLVNCLPGVALPVAYSTAACPVVLCWYIFTELGSILENARDMGAPVPNWLVKLLAAAKTGAEKNESEN